MTSHPVAAGNPSAARLHRGRPELANFLRRRREALSPLAAGLPAGRRRRTPGLRREEVAALAGVGLTWYTWLEQGRAIRVSEPFLDAIAHVLRLDGTERRHLFLLAQGRPPATEGQAICRLPPLARRLLDDLPLRPAYVMNLRWDVLGWNAAADRVFGFSGEAPEARNMLWMLFADGRLSGRIADWEAQRGPILASFRRDLARAPDSAAMTGLVAALQDRSPAFRALWRRHDVQGRCEGRRHIAVPGHGAVAFDHMTLLVDEERHLRLVLYAAVSDAPGSVEFENWLAVSGLSAEAK